jgi:NadR type nicotinamide-nucleotide adenylyltransferase
MMRVAITGPESCGKTSLSEDLARHYKTTFVPEFSRHFLLERHGKYSYEDLEEIAEGQLHSIAVAQPDFILLVDTEMLVMTIWSQVVFGKVSPFITNALKQQHFDLYILCDTDIPWVYDPLRENEYDRDDLFQRYYKKMRELKLNFIIVKGTAEERLKQAIQAIDQLSLQLKK